MSTFWKVLIILAFIVAVVALVIAIRDQLYLNELFNHLKGGGDPNNPPPPPCTFGIC